MGYTDQPKVRASASDAFAKAFEIVATPAVFGCLGWFADSSIETFPALTLVASVGVFGYQLWRFSRDYSAAMDDALDRRRTTYTQPTPARAGNDRQPGSRKATGLDRNGEVQHV